MPRGVDKKARKVEYRERLINLLQTHDRVLMVTADNVGSKQMQTIRKSLRGSATVLMGKNTMIRKVIRDHAEELDGYEALLPHLKGNVGFVFCTEGVSLSKVRELILSNQVEAAAKAGSLSPVKVVVPKGPTGMEPTKTSFFQALSIPTRISRGVIEIINDEHLLDIGDKVSASQAVLLQMLNIRPFRYGLKSTIVYDQGTIYDSAVLDLTDEDIIQKFQSGVATIAAISLEIGYPTVVSVPHSLINSFRSLIAISLETDYTFAQAAEIKELLSDPEKLAAALAAASSGAAAGGKVEEVEEEEEEEEEEEVDEDMGGLFGDDEGY